ncbi:MAG TPA: hypothetical protein VFC79_09670 [Tissierellaceae bacterium]|nr:hypothetical protein [Tissierellaceae bacterium]
MNSEVDKFLIMSAETANKLSRDNMYKDDMDEIMEDMKMVKNAINVNVERGILEVEVNKDIHPIVREKLRTLGYRVYYHLAKGKTSISWSSIL